MTATVRLFAVLFLTASVLLGRPERPVGLDVLPSLLELEVAPGESIERTVTLTNPGDEPLSVAAEPGDWSMSETGEIAFEGPGKNAHGCAAWLRVEPAEIRVPARGQAAVRVRIETRPELSGTRWAVVFFSLPTVPAFIDGRPSDVLARVALTVYVTGAGTGREEIELVELSGAPSGEGVDLRTVFENSGNTAARMRVTWQIRGESGAVARTDTKTVVSLPQGRREVRDSIPKLPPGRYRIAVMARWGNRRWRARETEVVVSPRAEPARPHLVS